MDKMTQSTIYLEGYASKIDFPQVSENLECDIAVIGAGLAGLALSFELGNSNTDVVLIEANRIGEGASGINGGFCSAGWSVGQDILQKRFGSCVAKEMYDISLEGLEWVKNLLMSKEFSGVSYKPGILCVSLLKSESVGRDLFQNYYAESKTHRFISKVELNGFVVSKAYNYGILSENGFQFNPLEFLNTLKKSILGKSVRIFENTKMISFSECRNGCSIKLNNGHTINCKKMVLATGGYGAKELGELKSYWLPLTTYIGVSSSFQGIINKYIKTDVAYFDDRRAGNYFRVLDNERLLWGRGLSAVNTNQIKRLEKNIQNDLRNFFPDLINEIGGDENFALDYKWAGKMAYSFDMMPYINHLSPNVFCLTGFGGHGMNSAPAAAIVLSEYLLGKSDRLSIFQKIPFKWNGGKFGRLVAEGLYKFMKFKDSLSILKSRYF